MAALRDHWAGEQIPAEPVREWAPGHRIPHAGSGEPHGTVDAHLAEQMKDPEFRAAFEAEGESELRRAAGGLVRFCQEPSYARKEHRTDTMFHMQLAGLVAALKAALESKD